MTKSLQDLLENTKRNEESGCLEWQRYRNEHGYGRLAFGRKLILAHRAAWCLSRGIQPVDLPPSWNVLHSCDNPACINPEHLSLGTHQRNHREKAERGRATQGEDMWSSKLSEDDVLAILEEFQSGGVYQTEIASRYGVSPSVVSRIVSGKAWPGVKAARPGPVKVEGSIAPAAKLTEADVQEIRRAYAAGEGSQSEIARRFGVQQTAISAIVRRRTWKHIA